MNIIQKPGCIININEKKTRHYHKIIDYKKETNSKRYPTFFNGDDIEGVIEIKLRNNQTISHNGIRAELHGIIEQYGKINTTIYNFLNLGCEISRPGAIISPSSKYSFSFKNNELKYESYKGINYSVKYFIKIIIIADIKNYTYEKEFGVALPNDNSIIYKNDEIIKMPLGIKGLLDLDIEIEHSNYNCRGTIKGFISFTNIHLDLKYMEIELIKRERSISNINNKVENITIDKFELIDGSPYKNEKIPFRFFLVGYNLTPSYLNVNNIFSLKYYISLNIGDNAGNTFFKEKEIILYRIFKTKNNDELKFGPFEEFITEPMYNEEYYFEDEKKTEEVNKGDEGDEGDEGEEDEEEEEEEKEENETDLNIISTSSKDNKKKENVIKKDSIVNILRANSIYQKNNEDQESTYYSNDNNIMRRRNNSINYFDNSEINRMFNGSNYFSLMDDDNNNITTNFLFNKK